MVVVLEAKVVVVLEAKVVVVLEAKVVVVVLEAKGMGRHQTLGQVCAETTGVGFVAIDSILPQPINTHGHLVKVDVYPWDSAWQHVASCDNRAMANALQNTERLQRLPSTMRLLQIAQRSVPLEIETRSNPVSKSSCDPGCGTIAQ